MVTEVILTRMGRGRWRNRRQREVVYGSSTWARDERGAVLQSDVVFPVSLECS